MKFKNKEVDGFDFYRVGEDYEIGIYNGANALFFAYGDREAVSIPFQYLAKLLRADARNLEDSPDFLGVLDLR
jgi:hypothetical protein